MRLKHFFLALYLFSLTFCIKSSRGEDESHGGEASASAALETILQTYDGRVRPNSKNGTVNLKVQISVVAVGPINEKDFTFRLDYFMRQWWKDERLILPNKDKITFGGNPGKLIWLPDLFVRNSKEVKMHRSITESIRTTINYDGSVYMSARVSAICSCNMELHNYPMDKQTCGLTFESYAYEGRQMNISWHEKNPIEYKPQSIQIEGYKLTSIETSSDVVHYVTGEFFPLLFIHLHVRRTVSYYIFRSYVPSSFLVIMTWGTFWLPPTTYPARVGIIVTNFLASSFILQGASAMYTKVPYTTAIEVYLLVNITFILAVMLEYIAVIQSPNLKLMKSFRRTRTKRTKTMNENGVELLNNNNNNSQNQVTMNEDNDSFDNDDDDETSSKKKMEMEGSKHVHPLDRISRFVFPNVYIVFLIVYFFSYTME